MTFTLFARPSKLTDTPPPPSLAVGSRRVFANLDKVESLPHLSDTAARAMTLANDPDATLADMATLIRRDGVLTAGVLKLANSVVYGSTSEVTDVQQAVMRIGLRGCGGVISAAGVRNLYAKLPAAVRGPCEAVLRHSLFVGGLAAAVGRHLRLGLGGEEYTAGLLHDIGRVVMCVHAPEHYLRLCQTAWDVDPDARMLEREAFGTDHCMVGMLFAVRNGLPTRIARAIRNHHDPESEVDYRPLAAVVAFADAVTNHLHKNRTLDDYSVAADPAFDMLARLAPPDRVAQFADDLKRLMATCLRETRAVLKSLKN